MSAMANDLTLYQTHGPDWWQSPPRFVRLLARLVPVRLGYFQRAVGSWRGLRVLDLGCGGGFMAEALAARGAVVFGVDLAWAALAAGRRHAAGRGLALTYAAGRGEALPLGDASLDAVLCCDVLEHVADLEAVLDEVARVLAPGGRFLFETVNRNLLARWVVVTLGEGLGFLPRGTHDPALFIRPRDLAALLAARGFTVGPMAGLGPVGLDRRLDLVFGRLPTTAVQYLGWAVRG